MEKGKCERRRSKAKRRRQSRDGRQKEEVYVADNPREGCTGDETRRYKKALRVWLVENPTVDEGRLMGLVFKLEHR